MTERARFVVIDRQMLVIKEQLAEQLDLLDLVVRWSGQSLERFTLDTVNLIFELRNLLERLRGQCRTGILCSCLSNTEDRGERCCDRNEGVDRSHRSSLHCRWIWNNRLIAVLGGRDAED